MGYRGDERDDGARPKRSARKPATGLRSQWEPPAVGKRERCEEGEGEGAGHDRGKGICYRVVVELAW